VTKTEIGLRVEIVRNLDGLMRAAMAITEDTADAEDLIEAAVSRIYLDDHNLSMMSRSRLKVRLFKSLVESAPDEWLPCKSMPRNRELRRDLVSAIAGSGSAVTDILDGDATGHDGVADVIRQLDNNLPEPNLDKLRPMTRLIMVLKTHEQFSYGEIGRICSMSEADVRAYLQLGRRKIVRDVISKTLSDNQQSEAVQQ